MAYRINDNTNRVNSESDNKLTLAIRFALDDIHRESNSNTPKLTGALRANIRKTVSGTKGKIRWGQKYAEYQERGYTTGKVRRYTTAGTGAHFAENAVRKVAKDPIKYLRKAA